MKKTLWIILSIFVAVIIVMDVVLFLSGSLEVFPTAEQIEKGRIVYGALFVVLATFEAFMITRVFMKK